MDSPAVEQDSPLSAAGVDVGADGSDSVATHSSLKVQEVMIASAHERFASETSEHVLDVLHDDGLYRHLRFQKPGTSMYYFDLVTWPGNLAITGDCGSFLFSRTRDMFEFFGPSGARGGFEDVRWGINPHYWSEKLQAPAAAAAKTYSYESFRAQVLEWFVDKADELEADSAASLREAVDEQLLSEELGAVYSEHEAYGLLAEFEHDGMRIYDSYEWDLSEYSWSFLWCCWALVWGIDQYRATQEPAKNGIAARIHTLLRRR